MRSILLVTLLALAPLGSLAEENYSQAELDAANDTLAERLRGCGSPSNCTTMYAQIALSERPGGALEKVAFESLIGSLGHSRKGLTRVFDEGDAEARRRVFELYYEQWSILGRGFDPNLSEKCVLALEDEDRGVRLAAARLIATFPVPGTAHAAIDAAIVDPGLTRHALHAISRTQATFVARWVTEQLSSEDPLVRATAKRTIYELGRRAVAPLKSAVASVDAEIRNLALDALLPMANADDVSLLYEWLTTHGEENPQLRDRVLRAVAEIESGLYEGEAPAKVPLEDPEKS